jgi:hypothetical protein
MAFAHTPEFRKILWGGLVAWIIQGCIILAWSLGHAHGPGERSVLLLTASPMAVADPSDHH